jgi:hypothetical protein
LNNISVSLLSTQVLKVLIILNLTYLNADLEEMLE